MVYTERGILKRSVSIMMTNFLKWKHDYRVWFVFLMEGFLVGQSMSGLIRYALSMKKTVTPFLLPFLFFDASIANGLLKVMVYFGVIVLFCNAPFCDTTLYSVIARSKKKAWWLGNCLYIMVASVVYLPDLCSNVDTSDHIQTILGKCGSKYLGGRCRCFKFVYGKPDIFKRCASDYISRFCPVDDLWDCMAVFYGNWLFDICGEPAVWKV